MKTDRELQKEANLYFDKLKRPDHFPVSESLTTAFYEGAKWMQEQDNWISVEEKGLPELRPDLLRTDADEFTPEQTFNLLVFTDCNSMFETRRVRKATGNKEWTWLYSYNGEDVTHYQLAPKKPTL